MHKKRVLALIDKANQCYVDMAVGTDLVAKISKTEAKRLLSKHGDRLGCLRCDVPKGGGVPIMGDCHSRKDVLIFAS